jgi:hypothetical protein
MAALFLLLAVLVGVVLGDAVLENTDAGTVTLFNRTFDQLDNGQLLLVFAGLGFLLALFLFLAFGSSRSRRARRRAGGAPRPRRADGRDRAPGRRAGRGTAAADQQAHRADRRPHRAAGDPTHLSGGPAPPTRAEPAGRRAPPWPGR